MRLPWSARRTRAARTRDLDDEVSAHLRMAAADRVAGGESPEDAAANARREFGNVALVKEVTREIWGGLWLEQLGQDIRFGLRALRRSRGFAALAVLCLTLGIGANAAVYSWIEGILLRPYALVADEDRLRILAGAIRGEAGAAAVSWPDFVDLRRNATLIDAFVADKITGTTLSIGNRAERAAGQIVSANYFDAIGVRPILGRGFLPDEESGRNAHPVVVISYRMWKERFGGDPTILGKTQLLNGLRHTIVGVAPEGFNGTFVGYAMAFWVPVSMQEKFDLGGYKLEDRGARWVESFVRLKPGVTPEQAQRELSAIGDRLAAAYPAMNKGRSVQLYPVWRSPFDGAGTLYPTLRIALLVSLFVLLIACANVSNLLLVRSVARRQEMTVRIALGAGRLRLTRQMVAEGLILSALATAGGLLLAHWCRNLLVLVLPSAGVAFNLPATIDWRVLVLCLGACLLTTLLCGLVPSIPTKRIHLASAIKSDAAGVVGGRGRSRARSGLVVLQVALSFVLVVGVGLLVKSLQGMRTASPGFSTDDVLISAIDLNSAGYDSLRQTAFQDELLERTRAIGGVQSVAYARIPPFSYRTYSSAPMVIEEYQPAPDEQPAADFDEVSPDYFATVGIALSSGREFRRQDDNTAPPVAVVNDAMAARYWPGADPIGRYFQAKGRRMQVVGVARTARYQSLLETPKPFYYVPLRQNPAGLVILVARTRVGAGPFAVALAREMHALDLGIAPAEVITMREQVNRQSVSQTAALALFGVYGGLALLLASIGLYGLMSYAVTQSRRELGLRMALGARTRDVVRLVLANGLALTAGGLLLGGAGALGWTRSFGDLLYRVSPLDPEAFGAALVVLTLVSVIASLLPAWRAARTDPVRALRG